MFFVHSNGHLNCVVDVETNGLSPFWHEIMQICILPYNSHYEPFDNILPFYMEMKLDHPERTEKGAITVNGLSVIENQRKAFPKERVAGLFHDWFVDTKATLGLREDRQIMPLAHNWPFDYTFIMDWLGFEDYEDDEDKWRAHSRIIHRYFHRNYRCTRIIANYINDLADTVQEVYPFPKSGLASMCNRLEIERHNAHDALGDCMDTLAIYRKLAHMEVDYLGLRFLPVAR